MNQADNKVVAKSVAANKVKAVKSVAANKAAAVNPARGAAAKAVKMAAKSKAADAKALDCLLSTTAGTNVPAVSFFKRHDESRRFRSTKRPTTRSKGSKTAKHSPNNVILLYD